MTIDPFDWTDPNTTPPPLTCAQCGEITVAWDWSEKDGEWEWSDEWWKDPGTTSLYGYICSRRCYLAKLEALR